MNECPMFDLRDKVDAHKAALTELVQDCYRQGYIDGLDAIQKIVDALPARKKATAAMLTDAIERLRRETER